MIILGIDPALANVGFGVITSLKGKYKYLDGGVVTTSSTDQITSRLAYITQKLEQIINLYQPNLVAMEETFINKNAVSSLKLGFARGAIMALIGRYNLDFKEFKPNLVKKTVVGVGHAEKQQVLHMVKLLITGLPEITSYDHADALAVAYTASLY
jgi:crossover junction endodeoxyribonuclease RuvC